MINRDLLLKNKMFYINILKNILDDEKYYIFIDEMQLVDKFEDVANIVKMDFNSDLSIENQETKKKRSFCIQRLDDGYKMIHIYDFLLNENIFKEV